MKTSTLAALVTAGTIAALAAPATAAYANPTETRGCGAVVHDHINKADNGHGTPSEWADLSLDRTTSIRCAGDGEYKVTLVDQGTLKTRPGAGTPNGTGGTIAAAVPGKVVGIYRLTVHGQLDVPKQRDTSVGSTAYVQQLFTTDSTVTGGAYRWAYRTVCDEHWLDSSKNNDGQGAAAGNITGKTCSKPTPTPSPTTTSPSGNGGGTPTAVPSGAPQTGDGTGSGGGNMPLILGGALVVVAGLGAGGWTLRHRGQH
jgi:hypothetical protein